MLCGSIQENKQTNNAVTLVNNYEHLIFRFPSFQVLGFSQVCIALFFLQFPGYLLLFVPFSGRLTDVIYTALFLVPFTRCFTCVSSFISPISREYHRYEQTFLVPSCGGGLAGIYNLISCPIIFGCLRGICHMTHLQYSQSVSTVQIAQLVNHLSCKQKIVGSSHAQGKHFFQMYNIYVYVILPLISFF